MTTSPPTTPRIGSSSHLVHRKGSATDGNAIGSELDSSEIDNEVLSPLKKSAKTAKFRDDNNDSNSNNNNNNNNNNSNSNNNSNNNKNPPKEEKKAKTELPLEILQQRIVSRNNHVQLIADRLSIALGLEFLGAFLLAGARVWCGNNPYKLPALGLIYLNLLIFAGHQSGGYFNPALVLAGLIRGKLNLPVFLLYSIVNYIGAFLGGIVVHYTFLDYEFVVTNWGHSYITMLPQPYVSLWSVFFYEFFYMFWFTYFYLMLVSTWMSRNNVFYPIFIAAYFVVALGISAIVTPGFLNPAIVVGVIVPSGVVHGFSNAKYTWLYLLSEYISTICGAVVFMIVSLNDHKREFREAQHGNLNFKPY
jgi:aquaporin Z